MLLLQKQPIIMQVREAVMRRTLLQLSFWRYLSQYNSVNVAVANFTPLPDCCRQLKESLPSNLIVKTAEK